MSSILHQDPPVIDISTLGDFVDYALANGGGYVPYTLTDFHSDYLKFCVTRFLQKDRGRFPERHFVWNLEVALDRLAKLAYWSRIGGTRITKALLAKLFRRGSNTYMYWRENDWQLESLGLLEEVERKLNKDEEEEVVKRNNSTKRSSANVNHLSFIEDDETFLDDCDYDYDDDDEDADGDKNNLCFEDKEEAKKTQKKRRWWVIGNKQGSKPQTRNHDSKTAVKASQGTMKGNCERLPIKAENGKIFPGNPSQQRKDTTRNNHELLSFKEPAMEDFLVARHHFRQCRRKCSVDGIQLTATMRRSARQLPLTGDIWRMTLGLLGKSPETVSLVRTVALAVIEECKVGRQMTPVDVTALCVEAVYESGNADDLASVLEEFTLNQTINYSNSCIAKFRLPYAVSAVGFLVRASRSVYGVHMANFRLDSDNIGMMADPVNDVSDNCIQVLNLSCNYDLGAAGVRRLIRFVVKATLLTHLDLSGCRIRDQGLALLSEFFQCCPLQFLRVSSNEVTDIGARKMALNFKYVPTLEWLDLSDNLITDRSAAILASALPDLPRLRSLDLRRNLLGDFGTDVLTRGLGRLRRITSLVLAENQIGEQGASALARNLWKTRSLRYVNVSLNSIPSTRVVGLKRAASSRGSIHVKADAQKVSNEGVSSVASSAEKIYYVTGKLNDESASAAGDERERNGEEADGGEEWRHKSVDLLAGRHDEAPIVERRKRLRPRDGRLRRSWHGLTDAFRTSLKKLDSDD